MFFTISRSNVISPYQTYGSVCWHFGIEQLFRLPWKNLSQTWIENNIQMISQANRKNQVVRWNRTVFASGMHEASCCFVSISPAQQRAVALKKKKCKHTRTEWNKIKGATHARMSLVEFGAQPALPPTWEGSGGVLYRVMRNQKGGGEMKKLVSLYACKTSSPPQVHSRLTAPSQKQKS